MKILLTGGTGFIGSYVAQELLSKGHTLRILARHPGKVPALAKLPGVTIFKAVLTDFETIRENLKGQDAVVHVALGWGDTAVDMLNHDTLPSVFLLEEAVKAGVKHFIYTSSTAALGDLPGDVTEETIPKPGDFYGATKASTENYLFAAAGKSSLRCNVIRPGYTFGNPVVEGGSIQSDRRFHNIVAKALENQPIELTLYDGTQFIHAAALAKIYSAVLDADCNREIFFGLGKIHLSWEKIAREAIALTGSKSRVVLVDKGWDPRPRLYRVEKIKERFGLESDAGEEITAHLKYLIETLKQKG